MKVFIMSRPFQKEALGMSFRTLEVRAMMFWTRWTSLKASANSFLGVLGWKG
jgi:hypothetical protein